MNTHRPFSLAALTALGLLVLAPEARSMAGDRQRGGASGGGGSSAPVSRPAPSRGDGGAARSAPTPRSAPAAPQVQRERPSTPAPAPTPRYDPPARREAPSPTPVTTSPRSAPAPTPIPDRGGAAGGGGRSGTSTTPNSGGSPWVPTRRDDSARTAPRREAPPQPTPWVDGGSTPTSSGGASGGGVPTSRRVDDGSNGWSDRRSESPRIPPGGTSGERLDRVYDSTNPRTIDLSGVGAPTRARFPTPTTSSGPTRPGLGARRVDALDRAASTGARRLEGLDARSETPVRLDTPIAADVDHASLRDRYARRGELGQPGEARRREALADAAKGAEASRALDGSRRKEAQDSSPPALDGERRKAALDAETTKGTPGARVLDGSRRKEAFGAQRPELDGRRRKEALTEDSAKPRAHDGTLRKERLASEDHATANDHERRIRAARVAAVQEAKLEHLAELRRTRRAEYDRVRATGDRIAVATNTGLAVALGTTFGACGSRAPWGFWDPYWTGYHGGHHYECNPWTNWGVTWWWGWTSWAWPCSSWTFGYWSNHWSFWWGNHGSPWWSYGCGSYPVYYSAIVYDTYDPAPVVVYREPVVIVQEAPAPEAPLAPAPAPAAPAGEGVVRPGDSVVPVPAKPAQDAAASGQASTVYLDKGDAAWRDGRYADAVHFYAKAVEAAPDEAVLHLILADALFATGDYHYAAYSLKKALELDGTLLETTLDKRTLYPDPREFDRQLEVLEQYVADHPVDDDARLLLAANYLLAKRPAQCADVLSSPYAVALRESAVGKAVLDRANAQRK